MISSHDNVSMALFCDFENVALGVRDANYEKFDIRLVLERLLLKGSIVIKKAYCDWDRYKTFKSAMHEANFELIEIPHVRQSGKNSADIRLVVDALDLCYTKSHVDTFVIISGDSDFSPLVSKLRENAKHVIGVGVKQSTSDLLIANCDEFIFYDDLVRENARSSSRRGGRDNAAARRGGTEERRRKEDVDTRRSQAIDIAVETFEALVAERGDSGKIWASALKDAIKRRKPDFNESYYGFRAFGNLLEEAQARGLLDVGRDEKSGTYVYRLHPPAPEPRAASIDEPAHREAYDANLDEAAHAGATPQEEAVAHAAPDKPKRTGRRRGRGAASPASDTPGTDDIQAEAPAMDVHAIEHAAETPAAASAADASAQATWPVQAPQAEPAMPMHDAATEEPGAQAPAAPAKAPRKTARKTASRTRRPRKTAPSGSET
ncbi:NYN domain-containing protein [Bordetella bronchialis]|uniref:NYN domain-containing protein n=1 Tax=Bordetella bronchialis TaxID=463025 RepID=A0ABN4R5H0_9BORD|nr:NYN domain-containing protein [Bordetella bronchialis]ANN68460.1 NYN domain-containing protein [Bordetella bronchialis]